MPLIIDPNTGQPVMIPDDGGMGPPPGPPPGGMGGMPPEMMAMGGAGMPPPGLGGGLGAPMPAPPAPAPPGASPEGEADTMSPEDHLRAAIEHAQQAMVGLPDDVESQGLAKAVTLLYQTFAGRQKEDEAALGVTPAHKALKRGSSPAPTSGQVGASY